MEDLTATLQVIALDARVQVDFNADVVARYRLVGYENRAVADQDFRNDRVDAGEIGAGHSVTTLYAVQFLDDICHAPNMTNDTCYGIGRHATIELLTLRAGAVLNQAGSSLDANARTARGNWNRKARQNQPAGWEADCSGGFILCLYRPKVLLAILRPGRYNSVCSGG